MFTYLIFVFLAVMAAPASARIFYMSIFNPWSDSVYVILPWEMAGLGSSPSNQAGVWNSGWNVGVVYVAASSWTNIPLNFTLVSKSSHVLRISKTYAGAQANDNSISCGGFPITITQNANSPSALSITAGAHHSQNTYYCGNVLVSN